MNFLSDLEGWVTKPIRDDVSLWTLLLFGLVLIVVCVWVTDGVRLLSNMAKEI